MKYIFTIMMMLSMGLTLLKAQTAYISFPDSNAHWYVNGYHIYGQWNCHYYLTDSTVIIDNKLYNCLFREETLSAGVYAYMRSDSFGRTYCRLRNDLAEQVINDFSLNAGDTIFSGYRYIAIEATYDTVIQGITRKCMEVKYKGFNYASRHKWVEGIGGLSGPTFPLAYAEELYNGALCQFIKSDIELYANTNYSRCVSILDEGNIEELDFEIYPNPTSDNVVINAPNYGRLGLTMYNGVGEVLLCEEISFGYNLNMLLYSAGLYFIKVQNEVGQYNIKKIIKQ